MHGISKHSLNSVKRLLLPESHNELPVEVSANIAKFLLSFDPHNIGGQFSFPKAWQRRHGIAGESTDPKDPLSAHGETAINFTIFSDGDAPLL